MKKFTSDFKKFITKGNVLDLAVAVIIGGAFSKIIGSLVKDILMPIISLVVGKDGFDNYKYIITPANLETGIAENAIYYGLFIQNVIDFIIIAFVVFMIIRIFSRILTLANQRKIDDENNARVASELLRKEQEKLEVKKPQVEDLLLDIKLLLEKNLK